MSRAAAARDILAVPLFHELFAELETAAVNACVYADHTDHEKRQAMAAEVRAIRNLRNRIEAISKEDAPQPARKPVA